VFMESIYPLHSLADLGLFSVATPQQQVVLSVHDFISLSFVFCIFLY